MISDAGKGKVRGPRGSIRRRSDWGAEAGGWRKAGRGCSPGSGVSKHTIYAWKAKYGGMDVS